MNSILANIFLAVQKRIEQEVTSIKFIDQDLGQLEFYNSNSDRPPVIFPCVLIDIVEAEYSDEGENSQIVDAFLEIRLAVAAYNHSTHIMSQQHKEKALEYYNLEHLVNKALHGWCDSQYFTPLSRKRAITERRDDNLRVRPLRYAFGFRDSTAMAVATTTVPRPEMDLDHQTR